MGIVVLGLGGRVVGLLGCWGGMDGMDAGRICFVENLGGGWVSG